MSRKSSMNRKNFSNIACLPQERSHSNMGFQDDAVSQGSYRSNQKPSAKPPLNSHHYSSAKKRGRPPKYVSPTKKLSCNMNNENDDRVLSKLDNNSVYSQSHASLSSYYSHNDILSQTSYANSNMSYKSYKSNHLKSTKSNKNNQCRNSSKRKSKSKCSKSKQKLKATTNSIKSSGSKNKQNKAKIQQK